MLASEADGESELAGILGPQKVEGLDLFDRATLDTLLQVCRRSRSLSEAGRILFAASRQKKENPNDADRIRKHLLRFGLSWQDIQAGSDGQAWHRDPGKQGA